MWVFSCGFVAVMFVGCGNVGISKYSRVDFSYREPAVQFTCSGNFNQTESNRLRHTPMSFNFPKRQKKSFGYLLGKRVLLVIFRGALAQRNQIVTAPLSKHTRMKSAANYKTLLVRKTVPYSTSLSTARLHFLPASSPWCLLLVR